MGLRGALPRAGARAARPGVRDRDVDTQGPRLPQPAPRGAVRAVPGRSARRPDHHARRVDRGRARPARRGGRAARRRRAAADRRPAGRRLAGRVRGARPHRRAVVDPGVPVLGERHRDLRRAPDVRGSGSGAVGRRGGRDPRDRQPRPVDARRARAGGRVQGRAPRPQSVVQPVPGAELPLRPGDHDRGRRRTRGARTGDARPRLGR